MRGERPRRRRRAAARWPPRTSTRASASSGAEISRRFPPDPRADSGTYGVARSGETAYVREITDEMLAAGDPGSRAPRPHPPPGPALGHHRGAQGPRPRVRHLQPGQRRVRPALRAGRPPAGRGARRARRHGDRQRAALHRAQPDRPHPPGQAPARAPAGDPAARSWPPAIAPPASSTRSAATSTTSSSARRPSGRSSSATCRARGPRPPPSRRWRATRCAPRRSRTPRPAAPCSA